MLIRARFVVLGCLALFSLNALAFETFYYDSKLLAAGGCSAYHAANFAGFNFQYDCIAYATRYEISPWGGLVARFWGTGCVAPLVPDSTTGECLLPPPTDAECIASANITHRTTTSLTNFNFDSNVVSGGCSYSYDPDAAANQSDKCFIAIDGVTVFCDYEYKSSGASSGSSSPVGDPVLTGGADFGGDKSNQHSSDPDLVQVDTPNIGDITTTKNSSDGVTVDPSVKVDNSKDGVTVTKKSTGDILQTTTITIINNIDGSSTTTTNNSFTQNSSFTSINKFNPKTNLNSSSGFTTPSSSGSSTTVSTVAVDGSTSTTVVDSGKGGDGKKNQDDTQEGSCLDNQSCDADIDPSAALAELDGVYDDLANLVKSDNVDSSSFLPNLFTFPSGTCNNLVFSHTSTLATFNQTLDICTKTQDLRDGLGWFFYIITLFAIYAIATSPRS